MASTPEILSSLAASAVDLRPEFNAFFEALGPQYQSGSTVTTGILLGLIPPSASPGMRKWCETVARYWLGNNRGAANCLAMVPQTGEVGVTRWALEQISALCPPGIT